MKLRIAQRRGQRLRDAQAEARLFRRRALWGLLLASLLVGTLGARFAWLQVVQHEVYQTRSEDNRIRLRSIPPSRGLVYDRNGRLLADNVPAYRLELVPEQVDEIDATLSALSDVVSLSEDDLSRFRTTLKSKRRFQSVPLKLRLNESEMASFAVNRYRFPGVEVVPYLTRRYPYGELFAHVIGYVGRLDEADLEGMTSQDIADYDGTTLIGKSGIEKHYEKELHGKVGYERVEINAEGRVLRVIERQPAVPGRDLFLSIDADLQAAAEAAFEGQPGAAVAVDPNNGEVLAMLSLPSYDPNDFVSGISQRDYSALLANPGRPLFNRALSGGYEPGSTLKPFIGLAGLELGLRRPEDTVLSTGAFKLPGQDREYRDYRRGGHGRVNLKEALAQSVNTYFYQLAVDLGIDRMGEYMTRFGFGGPSGIDLDGEATGILPSREWKLRNRQQVWFPGETVIAGIGQGFWVVTPLQLAEGLTMLANGGIRYPLHLLRAVRDGFDSPVMPLQMPPPPASVVKEPGNLDAVREGMIAVVHGSTGSAHRVIGLDAPYTIAGKSGTAQRVSRTGDESIKVDDLPFELRHRALFVAYAPAEKPEIAAVVIVEHGGSGSLAAAPVARRILDAWVLRDPSGTAGNDADAGGGSSP
ncbi:MAG: penicillin-binding protein 2 [Xanthomonadales bacterium]|nr:penicillin-binding protein 2 [Xanthomonadales bacterium]